MKGNGKRFPGAGRWSTLLALVAALGLLAAVACGSESGDTTEAGVSTTDASTETSGAATSTTEVAPEPGPVVGHSIGDLAPDFTVETVSGETFTLSDATASGSPVLLYFFATW